MAYTSLKAAINAAIKENGRQEITGPVLNTVLNNMVGTLGEGYRYGGLAKPDSSPALLAGNIVYLGVTAGTYRYYGNTTITEGQLALFKYSEGNWACDIYGPFASKTALGEVDGRLKKVEEYYKGLTYELQKTGTSYLYDKESRPSVTVMGRIDGELVKITASVAYTESDGKKFVRVDYDYPGKLTGYIYIV